MSYILDALKKTELEKNRKNQPSGKVNISGDLFHERSKPVAKRGVWKILVVVVIVSLVACAVTWFALHGSGKKMTLPIPVPTTKTITQLPTPVPVPATLSTPVSVRPQQVQLPPQVPATVPKNNGIVVGSTDRQTRLQPVVPQSIIVQHSPAVIQAPADIKLSGIAWQDEHSERRAVINGFLYKEGSIVSGATITDIHASKVRFSSPAGVFEIKLDAVLPSEVK
jgi:hypothetical protein